MEDEPKLETVVEQQKLFFSNIDDWQNFKQAILQNIMSGQQFELVRDDKVKIKVSPRIFYDRSVMVTYTII